MKCLTISFLLVFLALPFFAQSSLQFHVNSLKEENDSLNINYTMRVCANSVQTGQMLQMYAQIQAGDSILFLPGVTVLGKNKQKVLSRFEKVNSKEFIAASIKNDTLLTYDLQVPYALWMDSASLVVEQELTGYRNKATLTTYKLKDKVELSPREPYQVAPTLAFVIPEKEVKIRKRQGKAYLDFQVGRSVILPNYRRNPEELLKIDDAIREVVNNPDAILKGLYVEGYASPDGPYLTNERLSKERAQALKEYIRSKFNLSDNLFKVTSVAEDWDGLVEMVKASELPQKEKILGIISSVDIFDGREAALMKLDKGIPYRLMLKDMFPELRRVEYQVDYTVKDYDVKQTLLLLDKKPGDLSQLELYNLALSYEKGSKEYNRILLEVIPKYFPEDETANANAAAILISNGELATARRLLDKAGTAPAVINNTGIVLMLEGDLDKAEENFKKAQSLGNENAAINLQELNNKRQDNQKQERYNKNK